MPKNKIISILIFALSIGFLITPLTTSAAEVWQCWCGTGYGAQFPDYKTCNDKCYSDSCVPIGMSSQTPTCQKISATPSSGGQTTAPVKPLENPLGKGVTLQIIIGRAISAVLRVVGSIALLMFIYGGFLWLTARGNDQAVQKGKDVLTWATIGLAVIFLSYTLVSFVIKGLTKGGTSGGGAPAEQQKEIGYCTCIKGVEEGAGYTVDECLSKGANYLPNPISCTWTPTKP